MVLLSCFLSGLPDWGQAVLTEEEKYSHWRSSSLNLLSPPFNCHGHLSLRFCNSTGLTLASPPYPRLPSLLTRTLPPKEAQEQLLLLVPLLASQHVLQVCQKFCFNISK